MSKASTILLALLCFHTIAQSQYRIADTLTVFNYANHIDSAKSFNVHIAEGSVMNAKMSKKIGGFGEYTYSDRNDSISKISYHAAYNHKNFYVTCYYMDHKLVLVKQIAESSITGAVIVRRTTYFISDSIFHQSTFHANTKCRKELVLVENEDVKVYGYRILSEKLAMFKERKQFMENFRNGKYLD